VGNDLTVRTERWAMVIDDIEGQTSDAGWNRVWPGAIKKRRCWRAEGEESRGSESGTPLKIR